MQAVVSGNPIGDKSSAAASANGSGPAVTLHHLFGLKGDIKDNIQYLDESEVLYPAGHNIVIYNTEKKTQRFIHGDTSNGDSQMTAIAVSSTKHKYLAVAERGEKAQITIYDLTTHKKKGKTSLVCPEVQSKEYVSLCFSPDGKQLLAQGGAPDWTLVNWLWEKNKPLQIAQVSNQIGAEIHQCSYCPSDPTCVCITGHGILRFLRLEQAEFKSIQFSMGKREPQNYLCHTWVDDRILVGTDTGDILVFENAEFRGLLSSSPSNGKSIDSIAAYSKGFVCGCEEGVLYVFERDEKEIYKESKSFQIDGNYVKIKNLAISPSEDNVVCTLENNQAYVLSLSNTDILKAEEMNFEPLVVPFHHQTITGLDVCMRKPLLVTCGVDKSVRVWNYIERTLEVYKFFNEEPYSVAFHPSGLHLLVGFADTLRFMNLLMNEMRTFKEFPVKNCREVRFSHGGQYFAAANNSVIQIFSTYTCEMIGMLRGHTYAVKSLSWSQNDSSIISCGADDTVYEWKLKTAQPVQQFQVSGVEFRCALADSEGVMYAVGSDKVLHAIEDSKEKKKLDTGVRVADVALTTAPHKHIFAGTEVGILRAFALPLTGQCLDYECHSGGITRVRVSPDDAYVFTVAEDGCLAIFEINNRDRARKKHDGTALPWAEEILVTKSELEEKMAVMHQLRTKVEELQYHNQMQLKMRELNYQEKLREVTEKFNHELEADKERYEVLRKAKADMDARHAETVKELERRHALKMEELEQHQKNKMETEAKRYKELEKQLQKNRKKWAELRQLREETYSQEIEQLKREHEEKLAQQQQEKEQLRQEKNKIIEEFEETKRVMEEEADKEIDELKASYDAKLTVERLNTLQLKDQNAILKRKFGALRDDIKDQKKQIEKRRDKQQLLYQQIRALEKDVEGHLKEISERDSTIGDKVKRIFELRKKNQELEKFKFVLDYKIKELKRQIMPRQKEIKAMGDQMSQMDQELTGYKKDNSHLQLSVKELKLKVHGMDEEIDKQEEHTAELQAQFRHLRIELQEVFQSLDDNKQLKDGIVRLYQDHVLGASAQSARSADGPQGPADEHSQYKRQRFYLERSVDALKEKLKKDVQVHKKDHARITQENITLIKEINELRREIHLLKTNQLAKDKKKKKDSTQALTYDGQLAESTAVVLRAPEAASDAMRMQLQQQIEEQQDSIRALQSQLDAIRAANLASSPRAIVAPQSPTSVAGESPRQPTPPTSQRPERLSFHRPVVASS